MSLSTDSLMTRQASPQPASVRPITGRTVLFWIVGFFLVVFVANGVFLWLALGSFPGTVVDSSYKAGLTYNSEIAAAKAQDSRHWQVVADIERAHDGTAGITVTARDAAGNPLPGLAVSATLSRPTTSGADHEVVLTEGELGRYTGVTDGLAPGQWIVELVADRGDGATFRSRNRLFLDE